MSFNKEDLNKLAEGRAFAVLKNGYSSSSRAEQEDEYAIQQRIDVVKEEDSFRHQLELLTLPFGQAFSREAQARFYNGRIDSKNQAIQLWPPKVHTNYIARDIVDLEDGYKANSELRFRYGALGIELVKYGVWSPHFGDTELNFSQNVVKEVTYAYANRTDSLQKDKETIKRNKFLKDNGFQSFMANRQVGKFRFKISPEPKFDFQTRISFDKNIYQTSLGTYKVSYSYDNGTFNPDSWDWTGKGKRPIQEVTLSYRDFMSMLRGVLGVIPVDIYDSEFERRFAELEQNTITTTKLLESDDAQLPSAI